MHIQYSALLFFLGLLCFNGASSSSPAAARFVGINPTSLIIINGTYYYIEASAPKNWNNALAACQAIGYELVSLTTPEKFTLISDFLVSSGQSLYFWTSGNDFYTLGKHHWYPSGEAVLDSLWGDKQPDNAGGTEHCDELYKKNNAYTLRDDNCNVARNYICEETP